MNEKKEDNLCSWPPRLQSISYLQLQLLTLIGFNLYQTTLIHTMRNVYSSKLLKYIID